jgi:PAS domain S-box-containing protein
VGPAQHLLILNSTAAGIYRLDTNGICTFCNPSAARLLGYADTRELLGRSAHDHHHHQRPDGTPFPLSECPIHLALRSDEETHADNEMFIRADGSPFPVEYWSYPILSGSDLAGRVVTFLDITQRRDLEAQVLQSQKMEAVGRLAGGVAHDFNNALQVILFYAELLEERLIDDPDDSDCNAQILAAGRRAASLTRQLVALSRKQSLHPAAIDIRAVIDEMETMLRRTIGEDIALTINHASNAGAIEADRGQIEQLLINLANNARDAMPSGGELSIRTSNLSVAPMDTRLRGGMPPGDYVVLTLRDTGVGMDQATQTRIFEPFFTTKDPGRGTGLSLSTVYGIVNQSQGHIVVDSELGKGAEFRLYFPIVAGLIEDIAPREPVKKSLREELDAQSAAL